VAGLKRFPEAINSIYPQTLVQNCIVHLIRNGLVSSPGRTARRSCPRLRRSTGQRAPTRRRFASAEWGKRYPAIGQIWRNAWERVVPFFAFAPSIRKMIYTTDAVDALRRSLIIRTRCNFPTDEAALKLLFSPPGTPAFIGGGQSNGPPP
jgi:putative transposase